MDYIINISSTRNEFLGTGFIGEKVSSLEDVRDTMYKYATFIKEGVRYWYKEIKLTFSLASTLEAFKAEGDRQCKQNGFVNLFTAALAYAKDPFKNYTVIYRPSRWIDAEGNEFCFILLKGDEVIPFNGKLSELLSKIGIVF